MSEQPLDIQVRTAPIIKATAIRSEVVKKLVKNKKDKENAASRAEREKKRRLKKAAQRKKQAAIDKKRKKVAADKKRKASIEKRKKEDLRAEEKRKADADKKKKVAAEIERKKQAEKERIRKQREAEIQAQIDAEQNAVKQQRVLSELQKYKALIVNKITRNWNKAGKCVLEVRLGSGGFVIDVREVSGETAICRSAKAAVFRSDPLPVSKDPDVFNKMRTIRFTLDPEEL